MKPIEFKEQTCVYAKDQPEYLPLPTHKNSLGHVTSVWRPTFKERLKILFGKNIGLTLLTFNGPLQPQRVFIYAPSELVLDDNLKGDK